MDFGIFGFSPEQVQEFRTFIANQQAAAAAGRAPATGTAGAGAGGAAATASDAGNANQQQPDGANNNNGSNEGQQRDEPVLMHNAQHNGVMCDICNSEIRGFRYKCMQCSDFDLCSKCEHKGHHAGHIMMRISFPEQSRDAIRKYLSNVGPTPPPSPPHPGHHGFEPLFSGLSGRRGGHCGRRGGHAHGPGGDDSERPATAPGCPYQMGRKEFKKWSKWMKKASTHHHRSAEAYARAAAASGNGAAAGASATVEGEEPESPMDFGAVASQIQDFLNYWGVPVDVVELYDQFGNYGQPGAAGNESPPTNAAGGAGAGRRQSANTEPATGAPENNPATGTGAATVAQDQQPASPASVALTENLQQMRIDEPQNNPRKDESLLMDLDAENSGWTILNDSREQSPGNTTGIDTQRPGVVQGSLDQQQSQNQASVSGGSTESVNSNAGNNSTPFASAGSNDSNGNGPSAIPSAPPSFPSGVPNVPLYPVLNPPQLQQILQGVSSAVSSVVRSIPIVTDPRGPMGTHVTNSSFGQTASPTTAATTAPESGDGPIELDGRSMKTLNQLLAMGFSNEGGYLTRLVIAKKGDLEAVLSSLFPN